jgi:hypothetical protein
MGAKKKQLDLTTETASEPSKPEESKPKKSVSKRPEFVPPEDWGEAGEGGFIAYRKMIIAEEKERLGDSYNGTENRELVKERWAAMDDKEKWEEWGARP